MMQKDYKLAMVNSCFFAAKVIVYEESSKYFLQISLFLTRVSTFSHFLEVEMTNLIVFSAESIYNAILRNRL